MQSSAPFAIAMPTRGAVTVETLTAITASTPGPHVLATVARRPVVEARNELARTVADLGMRNGIKHVVWIDDDAWWPAPTIPRMLRIMESSGLDMLTAASCDRMPFCSPGQFQMHQGIPRPILPHGMPSDAPVPNSARFTPGQLVPIDATSFHFVLMRIELLERLGPDPFNVPSNAGIFGEDMQFCFRATKAGAKIACDTGTIVAHVESESGLAFVPLSRPGKIQGNAFVTAPDERSDEAIQAEWQDKNIRANRRYGADVDAILKRTYEAYVLGRAQKA